MIMPVARLGHWRNQKQLGLQVGTVDQELTDAAAYALGRRCMYTQQMAALFCMKLRHGSCL